MSDRRLCPICQQSGCDLPDKPSDPRELAIHVVAQMFMQRPDVIRQQLALPSCHWRTFIAPVVAAIQHAQAADQERAGHVPALHETAKAA